MAKKFVYKPRTVEQVQKQAELRGGMFDSTYQEGVTLWKCSEGNHQIRILPPTWEGSEDFGLAVYKHSQVGPDNQTYLCPNKMKVGPCPVCEEAAAFQKTMNADNEKDKKLLYQLKGYRQCLTWLIDRDNEEAGPQLYAMPWGLSRDINMISVHPRTKKLLAVDNPDNGYDVIFTRKGLTQTNTEYLGAQLDQGATPLTSDENKAEAWLDYLMENPLPKILTFYSYEHIVAAIEGNAKAAAATVRDEEPEEPRTRSSRKEPEEEEEEDSHQKQRQELRSKIDERAAPRRARAKPETVEEEEPEEEVEPEEEATPLRDKIRSKLAARRG